MTTVGILHPGHMGAALGAAMRPNVARVLWCSEGRSEATRRRASDAGLEDVETLAAMARQADTILSICPPAAAADVAQQIADSGFDGLFVDANALSPAIAVRVASIASRAGAAVVDGAVIGGPPRPKGNTRMWLSGSQAEAIAGLFTSSPLEALVLGETIGQASALKVAFAAFSKGALAMQSACLAFADKYGLLDELRSEWERLEPGRVLNAEAHIPISAPKAWRFTGEMQNIASAFADAGLPTGFHEAAESIWDRWKHHRGQEGATPPLEDMLPELRESGAQRPAITDS